MPGLQYSSPEIKLGKILFQNDVLIELASIQFIRDKTWENSLSERCSY
jgi:hypothetical protein